MQDRQILMKSFTQLFAERELADEIEKKTGYRKTIPGQVRGQIESRGMAPQEKRGINIKMIFSETIQVHVDQTDCVFHLN